MAQAMTLSVVIPTYNRLPLLITALSSVLAQSHLPEEIIVIDDGSTENIAPPLISLQAHSPIPLHYLTVPHCGKPSQLRNRGWALAHGELVAFLDDDDIWLPHKLAQQVALHQAADIGLSHCKEIWLRSGKAVAQPLGCWQRSGDIFLSTLHKCIIGPSTMVVERALLQQLDGFNEALEIAEDYEFSIRASICTTIGYVERASIYKIGGHSQQLSMRYGYIELFRIRALQHILDAVALTAHQRERIQEVLAQKCDWWARGCAKRGRMNEAYYYWQLATLNAANASDRA